MKVYLLLPSNAISQLFVYLHCSKCQISDYGPRMNTFPCANQYNTRTKWMKTETCHFLKICQGHANPTQLSVIMSQVSSNCHTLLLCTGIFAAI